MGELLVLMYLMNVEIVGNMYLTLTKLCLESIKEKWANI